VEQAELLRVYAACHYETRLPGGRARAVLRIGQPLPAALQDWLGAAGWCACITAYNPRSVAQAAALNRAAQHALLSALGEQGARWLPAAGRLPGQPWREPSLLVADIPLDSIDRLAWRHSQNAIVLAHGKAPAQLRIYDHSGASARTLA